MGETLGFSQTEIANAVNDSKYAVYILQTLGPEIESNPRHAANAVLEGQTSSEYVDTSPQRVGFFMRTPAIDTTPLLTADKSEERTYTARAVIGGKEIGQPSEAVMVTVS